jgi:precorrin-6Y C5,15-methyltransferase (decarboxylating)
MQEKITIVGIGLSPDDLTCCALEKIAKADILVGGRRQLSYFPAHPAEKIVLAKDIKTLLQRLKKKVNRQKVVVLASGDPNFFGIAALFCDVFGRQKIAIMPNVTAFQAAFARIKEPWDDVEFVSVHGRGLDSLAHFSGSHRTLVIYCDDKNTPERVAQHIISRYSDYEQSPTWIFENLGQQNERITSGRLRDFRVFTSAALSMMIIKRIPSHNTMGEIRFVGIPDQEFFHSQKMITKKDIRILSLSRLKFGEDAVMWDIGAGCGSVSVEASLFCPSMRVYAIEKRKARFSLLKRNAHKFGTSQVFPILGTAPEVLQSLPKPRSVFIGGSGGQLEAILKEVKKRICSDGSIVVNCVTLKTLHRTTELFKLWKWNYTVTSVALAKVSSHDTPEIFKSETPVFIVHGVKEKN